MLCFSTHACDFSQRVPPSIRRLVRPWLESAALIGLRLDRASGEPKWSTTQPFSDRRHTRSGTDGANDDKDAHDRDKPHSLYPEYPCRDHDGQDYGANNEPVEVHPPGEQATQHCGSVWHTAHRSDRPKMPGGPSGTPLHPGLAVLPNQVVDTTGGWSSDGPVV